MKKLKDSPEALKRVEKLESLGNLWHEKQKEKILSSVIFLKTMRSPMEDNSAQYLNTLIETADQVLNNLVLNGKKDTN